MNAWISHINVAAAGWFEALLRATWQGAIALILVWMVSRWIVAIPGRYKDWLWRLAFLKLLVALLWITPISLAVLPARPVTIASPLPPLRNLPTGLEALDATGPISEMHATLDWRAWLLVTWIGGVLWGIARIARHWRAARALRQDSMEVHDSAYQDVLQRLAATFRLRRLPALRHSESMSSPMLVGLIRPSIILPSAVLQNFAAPRIEMMLAHELAHVRRKDLWWLWLFTVCETLFFFHPLVWLARREWNLATESACDELALRLTRHTQHEYGSMLIDVVAQIRASRRSTPVLAVGMFENGKTVKRRLKGMTVSKNPITTLAAIILIVAGAVGLAPCRLVAQAPDAETLDRLKEENAKLKQQLDAVRREVEALRQQAIAPREQKEALDSPSRDVEQKLEFAEKRLAELKGKFTEAHPEVVAQRRQVERLRQFKEALLRREGDIKLDSFGPANNTKEALIPARPGQRAASKEQRELLLEEIKLAERQAEAVKRAREVGRAGSDEVLRVQRELLDLKLQLAELEGSKAEQKAVLLQQLKTAEELLKIEKKRTEMGILPPEATIPFEREILRLKRALAALG